MEGLRGFAVLLVFFVHYASLIEPWIADDPRLRAFADVLHVIGDAGVDLFFVLSGYLIYGSLLARPKPFLPFLARRAERIYPAFAAVFATHVVLSLIFPAESSIPEGAVAATLYLFANLLLLPGLFPIEPLISVTWSLSYEMFYYLVLPAPLLLFGLRQRSPRWRTAFFLGVALIMAIGFVVAGGGPMRLLMFVSGILLYETMKHSSLSVPGSIGLAALLVGLIGTLLPGIDALARALRIGVLFVAFFLLCLACFRTPHAWLPRAFAWTPLRWLGNMSYSYYLAHGLALHAGFLVLSKLLPPAIGGQSALFWWLLLPMFALTLVPGLALFLLVERPFSLAPPRQRSASETTQAAFASESES